jgi:pimeloyl-ACP methyl ester carboxylesterase
LGARYLTVGGKRIETARVEAAEAGAPVLVFLHEGLGSAGQWRDFPEKLARRKGLAVFAYSRLGYGGSDPCPLPRPLTYLADEAEVLPEVLGAAEIEDYLLVGHSDGGSIALLHAAARPPGLRAVLTEAAHVFCEEVTLDSIAAAREDYETGDLREKLARRHGANVDCAFRGWAGAWLNPGFRSWNIEDRLDAIRVPVLALQGAGDPYGTPRQLESLAHRARAETHLLPGCGHAPHRECEERTLELMASFIPGCGFRRDALSSASLGRLTYYLYCLRSRARRFLA